MKVKKIENEKRFCFECEKGMRWSEWEKPSQMRTKTGDYCRFSGCLENDHKIRPVKVLESDDREIDTWFSGYEIWEDSQVYKSLL